MTYAEICDALMDAGIENAPTEALLIISFFCQKTRAEILTSPDFRYEDEKLFRAIDKRCERYPLQYIFGEWDFYAETYKVNENCLIPRSDTEILVDYAVKNLPESPRFADLCTGSGCIAISTLCHRPDATAVGLELFEDTAALAEENAERNAVSRRFSVLRQDVLGKSNFKDGEFDAIISNPPYIKTAVVNTLEEELFSEPRAALDGGEDGLVFYRHIVKEYQRNLKKDGFFLFEIGYDQGSDIKKIALSQGFNCSVERDLGGNPRMAILKRKTCDRYTI